MDEDIGAAAADDRCVRLLDYPYATEKRRRLDRLPVLIAAHRAALAKVRKHYSGKVVLIGKSMGSRIGCHVALEETVHYGLTDYRQSQASAN